MTDTYRGIIRRALNDGAYRQGLLDAARVARAQMPSDHSPPCPSIMAAVYIESLADGRMP